MRTPLRTNQFKRDVKRMEKRHKDMHKLVDVMTTLIEERPLTERQRDHLLIGNYQGRRECHVEPDWLLIYQLVEDTIIFERTGAHADLFE